MDENLELNSNIYTVDGKLLKTTNINSNEHISLPQYSAALIINVFSEGKYLSKKIVKFD